MAEWYLLGTSERCRVGRRIGVSAGPADAFELQCLAAMVSCAPDRLLLYAAASPTSSRIFTLRCAMWVEHGVTLSIAAFVLWCRSVTNMT